MLLLNKYNYNKEFYSFPHNYIIKQMSVRKFIYINKNSTKLEQELNNLAVVSSMRISNSAGNLLQRINN